MKSFQIVITTVVLLLCVLLIWSVSASPIIAEVVFETGTELGLGEAVEPGDQILAWTLLDEKDPCFLKSGVVETIFEWKWLASEVLPRSRARLTIARGDRTRDLIWQPESKRPEARPRLSSQEASLYSEFENLLTQGQAIEAFKTWEKLTEHSSLSDEAMFWMLLRLLEARDLILEPETLSTFQQELRSRWAAYPTAIPLLEEAFVLYFLRIEDYESGLETARAWLAAETTSCAKSWRASRARFFAATMLHRLELPEEAEGIARQALHEQQAYRPASLELAESSQLLGILVAMQGRTAEALILMNRALDLQASLAPGSSGHVRTLLRLANVKRWLGAFTESEEQLHQAIYLLENEKHREDIDLKAEALMELGRFEEQRGKYNLARGRYLEILELYPHASTQGRFYVTALRSLGDQAFKLEHFSTAETYYQQALEIDRKRGPIEWSAALEKLGHLAFEQGSIQVAREFFQKSRQVLEVEYQGSGIYAMNLLHLSRVYLSSGELQQAEKVLQTALGITEKSDYPMLKAGVLRRLSDLAYERGQFDKALGLQRTSIQILRRSLPSSAYTAFFIGQLGRLAERVGDYEQAAGAYSEAINILESLSFRAGYIANTDLQFRSSFRDIYKLYIDLLVETGQPESAFSTLEAVRAKSFLAILAERDLDLWKSLPKALQEDLEAHAKDYDATMSQLWKDPALTQQERESVLADLEKNLGRRETILREIRASHPVIASLRYPKPLDLSQVQAALDPGTLMLSFSIGEHRTQIFAVTKTSFSNHQIPLNEEELTQRLIGFRDLIAGSAATGTIGLHRQQQLHQVSQTLHDLLLGPVEPLIDQAKRLFIVPDGPLHLLPWAILARGRQGAEPAWQYLIERVPIHLSSSGTVFAAIKAKPRRDLGSDKVFVALADPDFSALEKKETEAQKTILRSFLEQSPELTPLPASRAEVGHLKKIYPQTKVLLGKHASEEAVKNLGKEVHYLHIATHSLLDERSPLNTAIVLTIPEKRRENGENGLLQVWEITEQLRIDADLVVLSACETALGQKVYGEGLIGLTRAFHHAGARSVMASLWRISDESTAQLIENFYQFLKAGESKDAALRKAQIQLIELGRDRPADLQELGPYHWGAFQVYGDWR